MTSMTIENNNSNDFYTNNQESGLLNIISKAFQCRTYGIFNSLKICDGLESFFGVMTNYYNKPVEISIVFYGFMITIFIVILIVYLTASVFTVFIEDREAIKLLYTKVKISSDSIINVIKALWTIKQCKMINIEMEKEMNEVLNEEPKNEMLIAHDEENDLNVNLPNSNIRIFKYQGKDKKTPETKSALPIVLKSTKTPLVKKESSFSKTPSKSQQQSKPTLKKPSSSPKSSAEKNPSKTSKISKSKISESLSSTSKTKVNVVKSSPRSSNPKLIKKNPSESNRSDSTNASPRKSLTKNRVDSHSGSTQMKSDSNDNISTTSSTNQLERQKSSGGILGIRKSSKPLKTQIKSQ